MTSQLPIQPTVNLGIVGHVDHGKTTLTKLLSGTWTDTHSEEKKKGITIKLGYTNFTIFKDGEVYSNKKGEPVKKISIVDAPGHESFMATMISGSAIMDYALLLIAANEKCPQPQTIEHLKTLEISGIKNIIVIQNKIDLVTKEEAIENFKEIKEFLKGTIAENAPIIPMSAQHGANISVLLEYIVKEFKDPQREDDKDARFYVVRSFDVNKPGTDYKQLVGGILGGSIKQGKLKIGDEIEIKPGIKEKKDGKEFYTPILAKIESLTSGKDPLEVAFPGGSVAIRTQLDTIVTKTDSLVGQIGGIKGTLPDPLHEITIKEELFDKVITSTAELEVKPLYSSEPLMIIVNSMTTVGVLIKKKGEISTIKLKKPVMGFPGDRAVLFRRFEGNKWRIIGVGVLQ
jgi:translation initiation factor 2 subunit 3